MKNNCVDTFGQYIVFIVFVSITVSSHEQRKSQFPSRQLTVKTIITFYNLLHNIIYLNLKQQLLLLSMSLKVELMETTSTSMP